MSRTGWTFAMAAALALGAACSDDPTGGAPRGGTLIVRLTTPHTDDGALTFEVSGTPVDSVVADNESLRLFTRRDGSTVVGAAVGALGNGAVFRLYVPNTVAAAGYTARVLEVADREDVLRASLAGYALTVTR